jgi:DNA adenine methylase
MSIIQPSFFELNKKRISAKPFLKWAGGKNQLLFQFQQYYPNRLSDGSVENYIEPFIGGGAVLFDILSKYRIKKAIIADINPELILAYKTIRDNVAALILMLEDIQEQYLGLSEEKRSDFYYAIRSSVNSKRQEIDYENFQNSWIERTAHIIFLNRTCFNGLFRVNGQGDFNVPIGRYKNPLICDKVNLQNVALLLKDVIIFLGDFSNIKPYVSRNTFVYFDPPYRPISKTSSFTSYSKDTFDDKEQLRLAKFFKELDKTGASLMLSNSDPKNIDPKDNFFENAYSGFIIQRLKAIRMINSKADNRGPINELLITNYIDYAKTPN